MILDVSIEGTMMSQRPKEAIVIIDSIAANDYQSHHDRDFVQRKGIMELDTHNAILAQNKNLDSTNRGLNKIDRPTSLTISTRSKCSTSSEM